MIIQDLDLFSGEKIDPPKIIWEEADRHAIIAFLLLSVDREIGNGGVRKLNAFMGISETRAECEEAAVDDGLIRLRNVRNMIIREGNAFLENIENDEDRYDSAMDELDRVVDGIDRCNIGNGYAMLGKAAKRKNLVGAAYWLFDYLKLVVFDDDYGGNKKRLLKHLARKWDIDRSVLPILEICAKSLGEISRKRVEIRDSDVPHREALAVLAELEAQEKTAWRELKRLHIAKDRSVSAYVTCQIRIIDGMEALCGIRDEDDPVEEDDGGEESLSDKNRRRHRGRHS